MGLHHFKCNKLDKRMVIIFDYRLNQCWKAGDDLVLQYRDQKMTVPHDELKKRALKISRQRFQSHFDESKTYGIYHFKWVPDREEPPRNTQQELPFGKLQVTEEKQHEEN